MKLLSKAKINLGLKILGRRPDGFHEIETLMVPISLADEVEVDIGEGSGVELTCDDPDIPTDDRNLAVKAARLFAQETERDFSARIHLTKKIPTGAGLGGGSSNAACVLNALDKLLGTRLEKDYLEQLAARLGSDTAFFVRSRPAVCKGRGEILEPFEGASHLRLLLLKPPFGVETPWAYQQWAALHDKLPPAEGGSVGWAEVTNDFEPVIFHKFLLLGQMKRWLLEQDGVRRAAMSGSGATLFAVLEDRADAKALAMNAKGEFGETLWTCECRTA